MLKRVVRWSALVLLLLAIAAVVTIICLRASPIPVRELEQAWYSARPPWSDSAAAAFWQEHRWSAIRAEADHFVAPIGPSRAVRLMDAWVAPSGDVFLRLVARRFSSSADLHYLIIYCWAPEERRFRWKALEDHSP